MTEFGQWLAANGYIGGTQLDDGTVIAVAPTVMGAGWIIRGTRHGVDERWSYPTVYAATAAWANWQRCGWQDEPDGWIRHQPSNRRRRNGDPTTEHVAP